MKVRASYFKWPLFVLAAAAFLWAKKFGLHYTSSGDENAYFYMARLMSGGKLFYRDFFFAHPPLQLVLLAAVYSLFGFHFVFLKLTASLPVLAGGGFIYHQLWRRGGGLAAAFFLVVFLFNYELLKISTHPFGLNLTCFFLMLSLYFFLEKKMLAAGLFWGCASITGLYALPWGVIPAVFCLLERGRGRRLVEFFGGFILIFGTVNAFFILLFGEKYISPVFVYHFLKPRGEELIADMFFRVVRRNIPLFFLPFFYLWTPKSKPATAVLAGGIVYLIFLGSLNPLFSQYFILPLPFLAWAGAESLSSWIRAFPRSRTRGGAAVLALAVLLLFTFDNLHRYVIHEEGTVFRNVDYCKNYIINNSLPGDLLFGHVTTVPLLALLTDRDIALDLVDTNHMRFKAGLISLEETLEKLKKEPRLKFFIIQESRFWLDDRIKSFLNDRPPAAIFEEPRERIVFFNCQSEQ